jgi:segregation and condensation protein A
MLETEIQVQINRFDGPLSLLLHLVQREEMNIKDLDVTQITQQYLGYLKKMQELNFDIAGEYLYMAATLLHLKSERTVSDDEKVRKLLEEEDFEITSKDQLIEKLQQLQKFQQLSVKLWELPKIGHDIFTRPRVNRKTFVEAILKPMDMQELTSVVMDYIRREKRKFAMVRRDRISIKEKLVSLKEKLQLGDKIEFGTLINSRENIYDVVITFISLLELARLKRIELFQAEAWGEIYVDVIDDLKNFDVDNANGFEVEGEIPKIEENNLQ